MNVYHIGILASPISQLLLYTPIFIVYRISNKQTERDNTIEVAIKRGTTIFVYGSKGDILCIKTGDEVIGYTCKTFAIRKGKAVQVFDPDGNPLYSRPC